MSNTNALSGLLGHPGFYKGGVCDNSVLDIRVMPAFFGEAYDERASHTTIHKPLYEYAENLKGKLLIMSGMLDANVSGAFRVIEALQHANKDFDMLFLPNDGHTMCSYSNRRAWDYFVKHLLGVDPPTEFSLKNGIDLLMEKYYDERV